MDAGGRLSPPGEPEDLRLLVARYLDHSFSMGGWFAPLSALSGVVATVLLTRDPSPEIPDTLVVVPVVITFALVPVLAGLFYCSRLPRIISQALEEASIHLAESMGMLPAHVPVFSDGAYTMLLAYIAVVAAVTSLIGGGRLLPVSLFVQLPSSLAGVLFASAWTWRRVGRPELLRQLALDRMEDLPSLGELRAWQAQHQGDDALLPEPPPVDEAMKSDDREAAVFEREMELSKRLRRGWLELAVCAASTLAVLSLREHLLRLGIALFAQAVVASLSALHCHDRYLQQIREQPRRFVYRRTHRLSTLKHQRTGDPTQTVQKILFWAALIGAGAYATPDTETLGWGRGLIAAFLFPFAAFNLLDPIIWRQAAWRELSSDVDVDAEQLMQKLGYVWSWIRGWQRYGPMD